MVDIHKTTAHFYRGWILLLKRRAISDSSSVLQQAQRDVKGPFLPACLLEMPRHRREYLLPENFQKEKKIKKLKNQPLCG